MDTIISALNTVIWQYVLLYGLIGAGLYLTVRLGALQFRHFSEMFRVLFGAGKQNDAGITPFQALSVSLASRVGTGNIVGVAVALSWGGAGAIFWMWVVALVGMATAYAEATLAQLYKIKGPEGLYRGGPAFYLAKGMGWHWLGVVFAIVGAVSFAGLIPAVQSNSLADSLEGAFGVPQIYTGIGLGLVVLAVLFGGLRKVASVAAVVAPVMALAYIGFAVVLILLHLPDVPALLWHIVGGAFGLDQAAGGAAGGVLAALLNGVQRGLFSNEAGMGSAPNIAASAVPTPHHPSSQGFVQALGVFIDTILVCTATALIILLSGVTELEGAPVGAQLVQAAMAVHVGSWGVSLIAVILCFFVFTTIIAIYVYAESQMVFLKLAGKRVLTLMRLAVFALIVWGSTVTVSTAFAAADAGIGIMAVINLIGVVLMSGTVAKLTRDYFRQRKAGISPDFDANMFPELSDRIDARIWTPEVLPDNAANPDRKRA
ncbi:AGCS family alanine or glycine:cation symporter [Roseibium hamelinense]|uniref:AGCS family alanine or glycine:cation symporter n=1 Tax=Roseibium hamelinense TaxID=150831 RepID=A0A562TAA1_9HYPH|nr:sodium:alanine symporter family protein [Roseibium hamelinense]MTI42220.1 sodium:alanine symporter family protein [Roseibium hamelinense]TWI90565.1 AGCS family alanine or glycine:cation symporter [Roseibium hamelinense]